MSRRMIGFMGALAASAALTSCTFGGAADATEIFSSALRNAGVDERFVRVANAGHAFAPIGGTPTPGRNQLTTLIIDFFKSHL